MMKEFAVIALIALAVTAAATIAGAALLLKESRKPESERKSEIFQPEHIDDPLTEDDWKKWDEDDWKYDEWESQWDNWDFDAHVPLNAGKKSDAEQRSTVDLKTEGGKSNK